MPSEADWSAGANITTLPSNTVLVGDIHGHLDKLRTLWQRLEDHLGAEAFLSARVVFLGDYVDRGPDTAGVLEWLSTLSQ
eukprot:scaffold680301_cov45-Prasinocladus_malaysianus.AAC.1